VISTPWQTFRLKAAEKPQRILLAEGEDPRVIKAAVILIKQKIAHPCLVGSTAKIKALWAKEGGDVRTLNCVDPANLSAADQSLFAQTWLSFPKNKHVSHEEALKKIQEPLILGCLYLKAGKVDGFLGGATHTTSDTLRAVFNIIGLSPHASTLFGFFFIERAGTSDLVLLADCAVIPDPSPKQLANIAVGASVAYRFFTAGTPRVALLSFSTLGSASHEFVNKVREALRMAREKSPAVSFEGEWQADTALDVFTAGVKGAGNSPMAGKANVLIVPDLNTGNIAYKLVQRLGNVRAVGPVLWGTAQPANDLSRGCSVEDIVDMAALTSLQSRATLPLPALAHKEERG
jgi:phosphate acetyltransferase